jgi:hypothetical protein
VTRRPWTLEFGFWTLLCLAVSGATARAEHAYIDLRAYRANGVSNQIQDQASSHADQDPPEGGSIPRPLLKVRANDPLVMEFHFTNTYPHGDRKGVVVTYFVVREEKARQKKVPDLSNGVVTRGRFLLNFKPNSKVGARALFTIKEPGLYLLRVQSENTQSDHEHFSAIDISVSP